MLRNTSIEDITMRMKMSLGCMKSWSYQLNKLANNEILSNSNKSTHDLLQPNMTASILRYTCFSNCTSCSLYSATSDAFLPIVLRINIHIACKITNKTNPKYWKDSYAYLAVSMLYTSVTNFTIAITKSPTQRKWSHATLFKLSIALCFVVYECYRNRKETAKNKHIR